MTLPEQIDEIVSLVVSFGVFNKKAKSVFKHAGNAIFKLARYLNSHVAAECFKLKLNPEIVKIYLTCLRILDRHFNLFPHCNRLRNF
jgi:hypothetical protein